MNGRKALYVGSHAQEIVGMARQAGCKPLDELTALRTLHGATTYDQTRFKRKLHRTTICGNTPDSAFAVIPESRAAYS